MEALLTHLRALTDPGQKAPYHTASLARIDADGREAAWCFEHGQPARSDRRMRVASVSKLATALVIDALVAAGTLRFDTPVSALLDLPGLDGITLSHLMSHTSGLTDLGGYVVEPPDLVADLLAIGAPTVSGHPPGAWFRYCNLGYILLGMAIEAATDERFDHVARRVVLDPLGLEGGFNWAGVPVDLRKPVLTMQQRQGTRMVITADGPDADWQADSLWIDGAGHDLSAHRHGRDTLYLSPHAGLRATVTEMARLAFALQDRPTLTTPIWTRSANRRNGDDGGGLFHAYGRGVHIFDGHPRLPGPLVGHAGAALGFAGGAWLASESGTAWAYALTGAPQEPPGAVDESFFADDEQAIMASFR